MFSEDVKQCRLGIYRATRKLLTKILAEHPYRRVQATVRVDVPQAIKMIERLGFKYESILHNYAIDGTPHYMYVKLKDI